MSEEYDLVVIGADLEDMLQLLRVKLQRRDCGKSNLGGTCLNGCIPSKTLLYYSEQLYLDRAHRKKHGLEFSDLSINFPKLMETKGGVIKGLNMVARAFEKNKVTQKVGHALPAPMK